MAQRKSDDKPSLESVLLLAAQLTDEEQQQLADQLNRESLRRTLQRSEQSSAEGRVFSRDELNRRLDSIKAEIENRHK